MTQPNIWMEMITETPELWERVVIYGQFQTIDKQENEQQKRNRRNNTFAIEIPEKYYARQYTKVLEQKSEVGSSKKYVMKLHNNTNN